MDLSFLVNKFHAHVYNLRASYPHFYSHTVDKR